MLRRSLLAVALGLFVLLPWPAGGQQEPEPQPVEITAHAVYAAPITDAIPTTLLGLANPSLMCIFAPQACPPELADVLFLVSNPAGPVIDNGQPLPAQATIPPGHVAAGLLGGTVRFQSALHFELPDVPDGDEPSEFILQVAQAQPTYNAASPLFRAAVDTGLNIVDNPTGEGVQDALIAALEAQPFEEDLLDIRACPLTAPFEPIESPQVHNDDQLPRDEFGALQLACQYGAFGEFDVESGTWSFDLTRTASAWHAGTVAQHGILLIPVPTNYIGIGDEDPSTHAQVTLALEGITATFVTQPASAPLSPGASGGSGTTNGGSASNPEPVSGGVVFPDLTEGLEEPPPEPVVDDGPAPAASGETPPAASGFSPALTEDE
ncbi:MAG: hypothetical protein R3249_06855, partial [Nitriliruptorales bacterium]|nr:hypothetical protein [Nitriliruptorales bacterium]